METVLLNVDRDILYKGKQVSVQELSNLVSEGDEVTILLLPESVQEVGVGEEECLTRNKDSDVFVGNGNEVVGTLVRENNLFYYIMTDTGVRTLRLDRYERRLQT